MACKIVSALMMGRNCSVLVWLLLLLLLYLDAFICDRFIPYCSAQSGAQYNQLLLTKTQLDETNRSLLCEIEQIREDVDNKRENLEASSINKVTFLLLVLVLLYFRSRTQFLNPLLLFLLLLHSRSQGWPHQLRGLTN